MAGTVMTATGVADCRPCALTPARSTDGGGPFLVRSAAGSSAQLQVW